MDNERLKLMRVETIESLGQHRSEEQRRADLRVSLLIGLAYAVMGGLIGLLWWL